MYLNLYLDKAPNFNDEGKFVGVKEVIKNGFNWYMIDYLYEKGAIHYLIKNNQFLDFDGELIANKSLSRARRLFNKYRFRLILSFLSATMDGFTFLILLYINSFCLCISDLYALHFRLL